MGRGTRSGGGSPARAGHRYRRDRKLERAPAPIMDEVLARPAPPGYRLRVGDWRVIYDVEQRRVLVRVLRIAPRGGAYE